MTTTGRGGTRWCAVAALALNALGCGGAPRVVRVYDGVAVEGRYVPPEAYAMFLRGALAEEAGDLKGALVGYSLAASLDGDDPELWARIGELFCRRDPKDAEADRAFARALTLDAAYAGAFGARARCALARGRPEEAAELARQARLLDPKSVGLAALVVRAEAPRGDPASRQRAIELTLAHRESVAAWDALIAWGRARRDAELLAGGLIGLLRAAPARSVEVELGAVALLVGGQPALARRVASAVADAPRELGIVGPRDATVARLAVDEALARGDRAVALARATRGHVSLAEVAARALVLDRREIAGGVAASVTAADPAASGAQMVSAALTSRGASTPAAAARVEPIARAADQPPELCALVFADRLAVAAGAEVARAWLGRITRTPMAAHDPLAGPLAIDLAARGVLPMADLPTELRPSVGHADASP